MNLLLIQTLNDRTKARTLLNFATEKEAVNRMYNELAYATAEGSNVARIVTEIIDDDGNVVKCNRWGVEPSPIEEG